VSREGVKGDKRMIEGKDMRMIVGWKGPVGRG